MKSRWIAGIVVAAGPASVAAGCVGAEATPPVADAGTQTPDAGGDVTLPRGDSGPSSSDGAVVTDAASTAFTVSLAASTLRVVAGSSASVGVTIAPNAGFTGSVTIQLSGLPSGVTADSLVLPAGSLSGILTLNAGSTPAGTIAQLAVWGVSGAVTSPSASLSLLVQGASGTLDTTFGTGGTAAVETNANPPASLDDLVLAPDGTILYSGYGWCQGGYWSFVARLTAGGAPDLSFNPNSLGYTAAGCSLAAPGRVWIAPPPPDPESVHVDHTWVALAPSGNIVLSGFFQINTHIVFAAELSPEGVPVSGFGGSDAGIVALSDPNDDSYSSGLIVEPDGGDIILGAGVNSVSALFSLLPDGQPNSPAFDPPAADPDGGIGADTLAGYGGQATPLGVLPNGDLLVALRNDGTTLGLAVGPGTGEIDKSLPNGGIFVAPGSSFGSSLSSLAVFADGSSVFVGTTASSAIQLVKFTAAGALDPTFGTAGNGVVTPTLPFAATAGNVVASPDGKILVSAMPATGNTVVLRFTPSGALDASFAQGAAYAQLPALDGTGSPAGAIVAVDPLGRVLLGSMLVVSPDAGGGEYGNPELEVARFWP